MMPKSTAQSRPSRSTKRLPGCMSAWKKPSLTAWRRKDWITVRPSAGRSCPAFSSAGMSERGIPSIHCMVNTSFDVRSQSTVGTRKSVSLALFSANSEAAAASSRKSISMRTERARVSTTSTMRRRRASAKWRSAKRAAKNMSERSREKRFSTPGRRIFTATSRSPCSSRTRALWTCAMEAAASGSASSMKVSWSGRPKAASMVLTAMARPKGSMRSCSISSSRTTLGPTTSGRVARNWPSFT